MKRNSTRLLVGLAALLSLLGSFSYAKAYDTVFDFTGEQNASNTMGQGDSTHAHTVAQRWLPAVGTTYFICGLDVFLSKTSTPTDAVQIKVWRGGSKPGTGTLLVATSGAPIGVNTILASDLTTSLVLKSFVWDNCFSVQGNGSTAYWFQLSRTGSEDVLKYYNVGAGTSDHGSSYGKWSLIDVNGDWAENSGEWSVLVNGLNQPPDIAVFSSTSYGFSNTDYGWLGNMFRDLAVFLFVPSRESVAIFDDGRAQLATKIPYSYFIDIKTSLSNISSSSGTFPSMTIPFTVNSSTSHFTLFSFSTVTHYIGSPLLATFRVLMQATLWIGFMYMVYHKVKHMFKK